MKSKLGSGLLAAMALALVCSLASPASAERLLCQRKKEKNPSHGSVMNLMIARGDVCPTGFVRLGYLLEQEDVDTAVAGALTANALSGPQGEKGEKGEKGDTGATGASGPQGPTGVQGLVGPQGEVGPVGPQGLQGEVGAVGPQGPQGITGPQGEQGVQGVPGPQGAQGVPGIVAIDSCYTKTEARVGVLDELESVFCNSPESEYVQHIGHEIDRNDVFTTHERLEFTADAVDYTHPVGGTIRAFRHSGIVPYTLTVTVLCCPVIQE